MNEGTLKRPFSVLSTEVKKKSKQTEIDSELEQDEKELQARKNQLARKQNLNADKVGKLLDAGWCVTGQLWDWYRDKKGNRIVGGQFYDKAMNPGLATSILVDKFYSKEEFEAADVNLRLSLCNAQGIKYGYCKRGSSLLDLVAQLEAQSV